MSNGRIRLIGLATGALAAVAVLTAASRAAAAQATVTGTVFDSLRTRAPLAGANVVIVELSRYAAADARGRFRFDAVPAGRYGVTFLHPSLDSLDMAAEVVPLVVPERGTVSMFSSPLRRRTGRTRVCVPGRGTSRRTRVWPSARRRQRCAAWGRRRDGCVDRVRARQRADALEGGARECGGESPRRPACFRVEFPRMSCRSSTCWRESMGRAPSRRRLARRAWRI